MERREAYLHELRGGLWGNLAGSEPPTGVPEGFIWCHHQLAETISEWSQDRKAALGWAQWHYFSMLSRSGT